MLKTINITYLIFSLLFLLIFLPGVENRFLPIYLINSLTSIIAFFLLNNQLANNTVVFFTTKRLTALVMLYSCIFVIIYNNISFYYRGNFFVFSEIDATFYHNESIKMASMKFSDSINYFLGKSSFEDLGAVLVISSLYRVVVSNLIVNFFYIIIGVFTALFIFRISKFFMSTKYAYICALTYSTSSFVLWYHSSGLKESFLIMLIVFFFDQFYQFYKNRKLKAIIFCIISLLTIMLFRPAIAIFCIGAVGLGILLSWKVNAFSLVSLVLIFLSTIYMSNYYIFTANQYMYGSSEEMIEVKEKTGMVKGGVPFTYLVNIISESTGPLPTFLPNNKTMLSIFSSGLIYRVILSSSFWFGMFYIIKRRVALIYPLALFLLLEMVSLIFIMEALELRKSLPHFPMIYIISFWFLHKYHSSDFISHKIKRRTRTIIGFSFIFLFLLIIYWNLR